MNLYQRIFRLAAAMTGGLCILTAMANHRCNHNYDGYEVSGLCDDLLEANATTPGQWDNCITNSSCPVVTTLNEGRFCRIQLPDAEPVGLKEDGNIAVLVCYYRLHDQEYMKPLQDYAPWHSNDAAWDHFTDKPPQNLKWVNGFAMDNGILSVTGTGPENLNADLLTGTFSCFHFWVFDSAELEDAITVGSRLVPFTPAQTLSLTKLQQIHTPDNRTVLHWQVRNEGTKVASLTLQLSNVNQTRTIDADSVRDEFLDITGSDSVSAYIECGIKKGLVVDNTSLADASVLTVLPAWIPIWNAPDCTNSYTLDSDRQLSPFPHNEPLPGFHAIDPHWQLSPVVYNKSSPMVSCGLSRNDNCNPYPSCPSSLELLIRQPGSDKIVNMPRAYMLLHDLNITTDELANNNIQLYCRTLDSGQNWIQVLHNFRPAGQSSTISSGAVSDVIQSVLPRLMLLSSLLTALNLMP